MHKRFGAVVVLLVLLAAALTSVPVAYAACDEACEDRCDVYFNQCVIDCGGSHYPGDPCVVGCRNAKVSCYRRCCV